MTLPEDERTLERLRTGDRVEFERLFREHYGRLCGFVARYVRTREVAEELVQETFLRLWGDRAALRVHTSLRAYLYASARNRALNHVKREDVEKRWSETEGLSSRDSAEPEALRALESAEVSARVRDAIARLPPRLRETVELRWGRQWSQAEIAEAMGISVKGVEANLARARAALRALLGDFLD